MEASSTSRRGLGIQGASWRALEGFFGHQHPTAGCSIQPACRETAATKHPTLLNLRPTAVLPSSLHAHRLHVSASSCRGYFEALNINQQICKSLCGVFLVVAPKRTALKSFDFQMGQPSIKENK
jgi:hypothetical protein